MAIVGKTTPNASSGNNNSAYGNLLYLWNFAWSCLTNRSHFKIFCILLLIAEIPLNLFIVNYVKYTEIDWKAYMQEVEGFINGTRDYSQLKGDTGPLVYPAGFVYLYSMLYFITNQGLNVKLAQYLFCVFYMINLILVMRIYGKVDKCPPYVFVSMCFTSYRVHSIFVLRLFNDPMATMIFYLSLNLFLDRKWILGSIFYSIAVGIKMNIFLFAPALFLVLLCETGMMGTIKNLMVCFLVQIFLGLPFLIEYPVSYLTKSFEFNRQFFYIWTVNWRLIPEELFLNKRFQLVLLLMHLSFLIIFAIYKWSNGFKDLLAMINPQKNWKFNVIRKLSNADIVLMLFTSNFLGMCFSRTLHYQFYVWYYHTLPFLLWNTPLPSIIRLVILLIVEVCWNTYPSTSLSSLLLHKMHLFILVGLLLGPSVSRKKTLDDKDK